MKLISGLAAVALAATTPATMPATTLAAAPAGAAPATDPAGMRAVSAGATWLEAQLADGILHNDEYGFDDLGLSADVAFALDAIGGHDDTVVAIADAVAGEVTSWYRVSQTTYTGSAAKAIALAQAAGQDATDFGGADLQSVVEDAVATSAPITGRVQNIGETGYQPPYGPVDSLNVISQSWAARALGGQNSDLADEVMSFLLEQQCDDGSFRATLTVDKGAPDQGCTSAEVGEVDTTALAVLNILQTPDASLAARGAAHLAASWLKTQQATDGSFSAGALGDNANTTGLAGWALVETGQDAAATKAASWLRGLQVADVAPCSTTLSADNGAIVYKPADLATARSAGSLTVPIRELARRASAQALPAMTHVPAGSDVTVSGPATAVESSTVTVNVAGLGAGEPACVSFGGQARQVTGTGATVPVAFTLPAGAATHTFRVMTLTGSAAATITATAIPLTQPAPAEPAAGELGAAKVEQVGKNHTVKLSVSCDAAEACEGKVKVRTARTVKLANGQVRTLLVAKTEYSVDPGGTSTVKLKLQRPARKVLGERRLRVVATLTARGAEPASAAFWLRRK